MVDLKVIATRSSISRLIVLSVFACIWCVFQLNVFSLIFASLALSIWIRFLITRYQMIRLIIKRDIDSTRVFTDQPLNIKYSIGNNLPFKTTITFIPLIERMKNSSSLNGRDRVLEPGEKIEIDSELIFAKRGKKDISRCSVLCKDPMNFFKQWVIFEATQEILVLPEFMDFEVFPVLLRELLPGSKSDFQLLEDTASIRGIREYSNDPINRIHWKASARKGKLHTKEFDFTAISKVKIYLDLNLSREVFARNVWSKIRIAYEEQAVIATASLVRWLDNKGFVSDLVVVGKDVLENLNGFGESWIDKVELLAMAEGIDNEGVELSELLKSHMGKFTPSTTLIIFSLYLNDSILPFLIEARAKCARVVVLLLPSGFRDPEYLPAKSYDLTPFDMHELEEKAILLEKEQIIIRIVKGNQSLQEVAREIEGF